MPWDEGFPVSIPEEGKATMCGLDDDDDEAFVRYCEIHSRTERALFSGKHINRLFKLAGRNEPCEPHQFLSMDRWLVADLKKEIDAMTPPCMLSKDETHGMLGTRLREFRRMRIREMYGWTNIQG
jgi:hypothetical protein